VNEKKYADYSSPGCALNFPAKDEIFPARLSLGYMAKYLSKFLNISHIVVFSVKTATQVASLFIFHIYFFDWKLATVDMTIKVSCIKCKEMDLQHELISQLPKIVTLFSYLTYVNLRNHYNLMVVSRYWNKGIVNNKFLPVLNALVPCDKVWPSRLAEARNCTLDQLPTIAYSKLWTVRGRSFE